MILGLIATSALAQRDPSEEILVYFSKGVAQKTEVINGQITKGPNIFLDDLRYSLKSIGITESMMEIALPRFNQADTLKTLSDGVVVNQIDMSKLFIIIIPKDLSIDLVLKELRKLPQVLYAEQNGIAYHCAIPNDEYFGFQWNLRNLNDPGIDIHATAAWDIYTGNQNNIIAIIDGGIDKNHVDLDGKVAGGDNDYGWSGHGVHVAGIAAAETNNNEEGIAGVDWNARIHSQRVDGRGDQEIYQAIVDAVNYGSNVKVINNSWALIYGYDEYGRPIPGRYSTTVALGFAYAVKAGRTIVAAMGNHEEYQPGVSQYPAGFENIIAVGASNNTDHIAAFSVSGSNIDVCAPGVNIYSTLPENNYDDMSGTSMATPHVSGLASLLVGYNSTLTPDDIENIIKISTDDINYAGDPQIGPGYDLRSGYGRINAEHAINLLRPPYTLRKWTSTVGTDYNTSNYIYMYLTGVQGLNPGYYLVKQHEVRKTITFPESFCALPGAWGRSLTTTGFSIKNPNYGIGFCEIVPNTLTSTGATLRTYVYQVWNTIGQYLGYYPTTPSNVTFAYSALGILNPTLTGPSIVCSTNTTFYLNNLPSGATVTWDKSSNLSIESSTTTSCTVKAIGIGTGWVKAILGGICNPTTLTKNVWVGVPQLNSISGPTSGYTNEPYSFWTDPPRNPMSESQYEWQVQPSWYNYFINSQWYDWINITFYDSYVSYTILARAINACGPSYWVPKIIWIYSGYGFSASPNPASEEVRITVTQRDTEAKTMETEVPEFDVQIYDLNGSLCYTDKKSGLYFTLPVSKLRNGSYIISISNGEKKESIPLIVKH